jgi:hypothetical protein
MLGHKIIIIWKMYNFHECNFVYKHKNNKKSGLGNVNLLLHFSGLHHNKISGHCFSMGVKRPECEADHSPPSSAEVKD